MIGESTLDDGRHLRCAGQPAVARDGADDQLLGQIGTLLLGEHLVHHVATEEVQDHVQVGSPWAYLKDVLQRLQGHPYHRANEMLPHG